MLWLRRLEPVAFLLLRVMTGLLFLEHGSSKLLNFPHGPIHPAPLALLWFAGILELVGGALVAVGLFTRYAAFVLSGEMAIGYFMSHAPRNFFPLINGGDAAVLFCFVFLYIATAGAGPVSLDSLFGRGTRR